MAKIRDGLEALGGLFFVNDLTLGCVLLTSCFLRPIAGVCMLLAGGSAWLVSRSLQKEQVSRLPELLNAGLWGLFIGTVLPVDLRLFLLAITGGVFVSCFCIGLTKVLSRCFGFGMLLSLPFALAVGVTAWVLPDQMPGISAENLHPANGFILSFFESISVVTFSVSAGLGAIFSLLLLRRSLWLFVLAGLGYGLGYLGEGLILSHGFLAPPHFSSLNYMLVAMALGGGLLPPDRFTAWRVLGGVGSAVVLQLIGERLLGASSWLTVTLSFNVLTLCGVYMNTLLPAHADWLNFSLSPEKRLALRQYRQTRYPQEPPLIHLPVLGTWQVYQSENGPWTHQHAWQHAVDFVLTDVEGARCSGGGRRVEDFYAWNKTVVSPIDGLVESLVSGLPDQAMGQVDTEHNWGNYVLIRDARGFRVLLAHLKCQSLLVQPGQEVLRGQWVGRCGNSGYSPEPHLHVHIQAGPALGDPTMPFRFAAMAKGKNLPVPEIPHAGEQVEDLSWQEDLCNASSYLLDQRIRFTNEAGDVQDYKIELAMDGSFKWAGDEGALYFGRFEERFMLYSVEGTDTFLNALFQSLPSMPLYARIGDCWQDILPAEKAKVLFWQIHLPLVKLSRISENEIQSESETGERSVVTFSETHGIVKLESQAGKWHLVL